MPFGIFVAAFLKAHWWWFPLRTRESSSVTSQPADIVVMCMAVFCALAGFVLALEMVPSGAHFDSWHGKIGLGWSSADPHPDIPKVLYAPRRFHRCLASWPIACSIRIAVTCRYGLIKSVPARPSSYSWNCRCTGGSAGLRYLPPSSPLALVSTQLDLISCWCTCWQAAVASTCYCTEESDC